eukprot:Rmarinus@m.19419
MYRSYKMATVELWSVANFAIRHKDCSWRYSGRLLPFCQTTFHLRGDLVWAAPADGRLPLQNKQDIQGNVAIISSSYAREELLVERLCELREAGAIAALVVLTRDVSPADARTRQKRKSWPRPPDSRSHGAGPDRAKLSLLLDADNGFGPKHPPSLERSIPAIVVPDASVSVLDQEVPRFSATALRRRLGDRVPGCMLGVRHTPSVPQQKHVPENENAIRAWPHVHSFPGTRIRANSSLSSLSPESRKQHSARLPNHELRTRLQRIKDLKMRKNEAADDFDRRDAMIHFTSPGTLRLFRCGLEVLQCASRPFAFCPASFDVNARVAWGEAESYASPALQSPDSAPMPLPVPTSSPKSGMGPKRPLPFPTSTGKQYAGRVVVLQRRTGPSLFRRVCEAEQSGAVAVIFINDDRYLPPIVSAGSENALGRITIPATLVPSSFGEHLYAACRNDSNSTQKSLQLALDRVPRARFRSPGIVEVLRGGSVLVQCECRPFGFGASEFDVSSRLVWGVPAAGDRPLCNSDEIAGNIVLLLRSPDGPSFYERVCEAVALGAVAVLFINDGRCVPRAVCAELSPTVATRDTLCRSRNLGSGSDPVWSKQEPGSPPGHVVVARQCARLPTPPAIVESEPDPQYESPTVLPAAAQPPSVTIPASLIAYTYLANLKLMVPPSQHRHTRRGCHTHRSVPHPIAPCPFEDAPEARGDHCNDVAHELDPLKDAVVFRESQSVEADALHHSPVLSDRSVQGQGSPWAVCPGDERHSLCSGEIWVAEDITTVDDTASHARYFAPGIFQGLNAGNEVFWVHAKPFSFCPRAFDVHAPLAWAYPADGSAPVRNPGCLQGCIVLMLHTRDSTSSSFFKRVWEVEAAGAVGAMFVDDSSMAPLSTVAAGAENPLNLLTIPAALLPRDYLHLLHLADLHPGSGLGHALDGRRVLAGQSVEAVVRGPSRVAVATVAKVSGRRVLIHFDGCDSDYSYWTDRDSGDFAPVGTCAVNGLPLFCGSRLSYGRPFDWKGYLAEMESVPAPLAAFPTHMPVFPRLFWEVEAGALFSTCGYSDSGACSGDGADLVAGSRLDDAASDACEAAVPAEENGQVVGASPHSDSSLSRSHHVCCEHDRARNARHKAFRMPPDPVSWLGNCTYMSAGSLDNRRTPSRTPSQVSSDEESSKVGRVGPGSGNASPRACPAPVSSQTLNCASPGPNHKSQHSGGPAVRIEPLDNVDDWLREGMYVEAMDLRYATVAPATIEAVDARCEDAVRVYVHFDGRPRCFDYWADWDGAFVAPIGTCAKNGIPLTPPPGFVPPARNRVVSHSSISGDPQSTAADADQAIADSLVGSIDDVAQWQEEESTKTPVASLGKRFSWDSYLAVTKRSAVPLGAFDLNAEPLRMYTDKKVSELYRCPFPPLQAVTIGVIRVNRVVGYEKNYLFVLLTVVDAKGRETSSNITTLAPRGMTQWSEYFPIEACNCTRVVLTVFSRKQRRLPDARFVGQAVLDFGGFGRGCIPQELFRQHSLPLRRMAYVPHQVKNASTDASALEESRLDLDDHPSMPMLTVEALDPRMAVDPREETVTTAARGSEKLSRRPNVSDSATCLGPIRICM